MSNNGAIKVWEEMRANRCRPTVVSYTAYMKILFDHKRVDDATAMYKEMLDCGLSLTCHTYTILMEYLACSGNLLELLFLYYDFVDTDWCPVF